MPRQPLDRTATQQADDVFYCLHQNDADLFTASGDRIPLQAGDSRCGEWCDLYDAILAHNSDGSQPFPDCGEGHDHHPADCEHCQPSIDPPDPQPDPPDPQPDPPDPQPVEPVEPCPANCHIVSIEWLDGDDDTTTAAADHYVNLPRDAKWVTAPEAPNIDRLGMKPRFKVTFDKPCGCNFKYKLVPGGGTPAYSDAEKLRHGNFKYTEDEKNGTTGADGTVILQNLQLVAGGGYEFSLSATDEHGTTVTSGTLTTKRMFWYVEAKMTGLTSILGSTAPMEAEYGNHHMKLKKLPDLAIAHQENIGNNADSATLAANVAAAVNASATTKAKEPYLLTIAYTDHLAVKNPGQVNRLDNQTVGPGQPDVVFNPAAFDIGTANNWETRRLWSDIVTGEGWLVAGSGKFIAADGTETAIPDNRFSEANNHSEIHVDVTGLPAGNGSIEVTVNVVDRMRGGLALGGNNQTCVCTRAWWRDRSDSRQVRTAIHEFGHKVQMVCDGTGIMPDKPAFHYTGSGHRGPHCHNGIAAAAHYGGSANLAASTCVMFGSNNEKNPFCAECAPAVKKIDLNAGW